MTTITQEPRQIEFDDIRKGDGIEVLSEGNEEES